MKFQFKMGFLTLTQIPCHHVLANEITLNLKYRLGHKHFFNINFRIGIRKKLLFCLYFRHISLCFYSDFDRESSLDAELISGISCFWGSKVHQKYAKWVLIGCII